jgi:translation initiation factor IF-2
VEVGCRLRGRRGKKVLCEEGELKQLRRFQDNVTLVEEGTECGLFTPAFENWEEGDEIEAFVYKRVKNTLEEASKTFNAALEEKKLHEEEEMVSA